MLGIQDWTNFTESEVSLEDGKIKNLADFEKLLEKTKQLKPSMFPWFEAIFSKNTVLNINSVLSQSSSISSTSQETKYFWNCKKAVEILHKAMTKELLNPLSLESDELLAFDVFRSEDCIATSFWVPVNYLIDPKMAVSYLGKVVLMPFPTQNGQGIIPKVTFNIWQNINDKITPAISNLAPIGHDNFKFLECNYKKDLNWINQNYIEQYDQLVIGDFD